MDEMKNSKSEVSLKMKALYTKSDEEGKPK